MFRLDDQTALVTGASQGIGAAIARALADRGARVVLAARSVDKLEALAEEIRSAGGEARSLALDISDPAAATEALGTLGNDWAIDVLVNNAGITRDSLLMRMSLEQWREVIDTNLTGAFAVTKALTRGMMRKRFGRIIFVSSVIGLMGNPGQANYAASKAGLVGFAKSVARELGSRGITSNVIAPGFVETAMTEALDEKVAKDLESQVVLRRLGQVEDIAAAAVFLASREAGYITGEVLNVSGGLYI